MKYSIHPLLIIRFNSLIMRFILKFALSFTLLVTTLGSAFSQNDWLDNLTVTYNDCDGCVTVTFIAANRETHLFQDRIGWLEIEYQGPSTNLGSTYYGGGTFFFMDNVGSSRYGGMITTTFPNENGTADAQKDYYLRASNGGSYTQQIVGGNVLGVVKFCDMPDDMFGGQTKILISGWYDYVPGGGLNFTENTAVFASGTQLDANTPLGLTATTGDHCSHVALAWQNPSNSCPVSTNKVRVYRSIKGQNNYGYITELAGNVTTYNDASAQRDVEYDYLVQHVFRPNSNRVSTKNSTSRTGYIQKSPSTPLTPTVDPDECDGQVDISWNPLPTAISYNIYRNGVLIGNTSSTAFTDNTPTLDQDNYYTISQVNNCNIESAVSPAGIALTESAPNGPTTVTATVNGANINVAWNDNNAHETGYIIERSFPGGSGTLDIEVGPNVTSYIDQDASICVTYNYTVKAKTDCYPDGVGITSASAMLSPDLSTAMSNLTASKGYFTNNVQLNWDLASNAQINRIKIERRVLGSGQPFSQIASENSGTEIYIDNNAEAGTFYEYKVFGESQCENATITSNILTDVGFQLRSGQITGNVSYEGGNNVEGVKIVGESTNSVQSKVLRQPNMSSYLQVNHNANQNVGNEVLLELWINPDTDAYNQNFRLIEKGGDYNLEYQSSSQNYLFSVGTNVGTPVISMGKNFVPSNQWSHVAAQVYQDSIMLIVNGQVLNAQPIVGGLTNIANNGNNIFIANGFKGLIKEVRIWKKGKSREKVENDHSRFMNGNETDLFCYLPLTEGVGNFGYDRSQDGQSFNRNHGTIVGGQWTNDPLPLKTQLGYASYSDDKGNYILTLPFNNSGENYELTPIFGTHEFDPSTRLIFVGEGNTVINNLDFTDISSFRVTGQVLHKGTNCPSSGVFLKVDGENVVQNGGPVATDAFGNFEMQVPIGQHVITLEKVGHDFSAGRFPPDQGLFDFQEDVAQIEFVDSTLRIVTGKVVGGIREGNKPIGLGRSKNNIGMAELTFNPTATCGWISANMIKSDTVTLTDGQTGEYNISLPPLNYTVETEIVNNMGGISFDANTLNLTNIPFSFLEQDTQIVNGTEIVDSFRYHKELDFIYRSSPMVDVQNDDGTGPLLGEESYVYTHTKYGSDTLNLFNSALSYPVFIQGNSYKALISTFEKYTNYDGGAGNEIEDKVPVTDGVLTINNRLAINQSQVINLGNIPDYDGDTLYAFNGGIPNITANQIVPEYSFTKVFEVDLDVGVQSDKWEPNTSPPSGGDNFFRGYLLGTEDVQESDYVLQGPEMVDYILRDPPGSQSFASREIGISTTNEYSWDWNVSGGFDINKHVYAGVKFSTGFGFITESDTKATVSIGVSGSAGGGDGRTVTETITNLDVWSTSAEPLLAGHQSDLFIGTSRNYLFGVATALVIVQDSICGNNTSIECFGSSFNNRRIAVERTLALAPGDVQSEFFITQDKIETDEIPDLERLRNALISNDPRYVSNLPIDHPCFGVNNDYAGLGTTECPSTPSGTPDPDVYNRLEDSDGPSYTYTRNSINEVDSVRVFNQQIRLWQKAIENNEKEKAQAESSTTIAFGGGGSSLTRSISSNRSVTTSNTIEFQFEENLGLNVGFNFGGIGYEDTYSVSLSQSRTQVTSGTQDTTKVTSFTLSDDSEWDDFLIDVSEGSNTGGPVFKILGGRSSCPHEGRVVSKYYQPGTVLSSGSIQLEQPQLTITPSKLDNIPLDEPGIFTAHMANNNAVGESWEYSLSLLNHTNPGGAIIINSGTSELGSLFNINAGEEIQQRIIVEAGASYSHDSLLFVLHSTCQYQQGASSEKDIADSAYFSINFIPGCTAIELGEPENQFVLNNSFDNRMEIMAEGYNVNYLNFDHIKLEYKPSNENTWVNLETYHYDTSGMNDPTAIPIDLTRSNTVFDWDVSQIPDGPYDLRATTSCQVAEEESVIHSGYFDRINPHAFGTPSPGDGILDPNDDISIQFNEVVDIGTISDFNFDVRGVINGSDLRHQESMAFDGIDDYAVIPEYNLSKRSFTIEFWVKRNSLGKQMVFSQGLSSNHMVNIGFDSDNRVLFELGNKSLKSNDPVTSTSEWHHVAVIYDDENSTAEIIVDSNSSGRDAATSNVFTVEFTGAGPIYLGQSSSGTAHRFDGFLHELRMWSSVRSGTEIFQKLNKTLSGRELGLIGCWPMDEAWASTAYDKVRGRHAQMSGASWSILPQGNAYHFNEVNEYLEANNAGTLAFNSETDLTFEFWFKGGNSASNMTVLSNGKADGTGSHTGAWDIFFNTAGELVIQNDGNEVKTSKNHLDNDWHHFAAVVSRLGNVLIYKDGQLIESGLALPFKEFGGPKLWVGCRGYFSGNLEMRDQYFTGFLDDIRIWNLARTSEQIERDFVNAMTGDELGLEAYYPFDNFETQLGVPVLTSTLDDQSMSEFDYPLTLGSGALSYSNQTAPIKLARPVKKVNYNYSVNQDEIIIQINEDPAIVENVTLDITVKGIRDLAGNYMEAPRTWIAYIDKNQVFWNEEYMEFEKEEGEALSFEANVRNSGGASQSFVIGNLPPWLTASPSSGVIGPNATVKITFTVDPLMDIGEFTQDVFVTGDFGFNEKLVVDLKNTATPPVWTVNPNEFQYSMNITGTLLINDVISIDEEDMVAAYIDDELVGVGDVQYFQAQGTGLVFLTINSHRPQGDTITFHVWDASEGRLLVDVIPDDIEFVNGAVMGNGANPVEIRALALAQLTYNIAPGWNWISFPIQGEALKNIDTLFSELSLQQNDQFESLTQFASIDANGGWSGNLDTVNIREGYKLFADQGGTFKYEGIFQTPSDHPIDLNNGWTWVGMIAEQNISLTTALASLDPENGDIIKSQKRFAVYDDFFGWVGNLNTLIPQEGYLIKLNGHTDQLIYPSSLNSGLRSQPIVDEKEVEAAMQRQYMTNLLELDEHRYSETMNMVIQVNDCNLNGSTNDWYVVAISGGETRGVSEVQYDAGMDGYMSYLTVYGVSNEELEYRLVKGDLTEQVMLEEKENFAKNTILGDPSSPYTFACVYNPNACPDERQLSTVDMVIEQKEMRYRARVKISTNASVDGNTELFLHAGQEVELLQGFEVKEDALLEVQIEDCPED